MKSIRDIRPEDIGPEGLTIQATLYRIKLQGRVPGGEGIEFLRAEVLEEGQFLVPVAYTLNGEKQQYGLRMDRGKGIFIDVPDYTNEAQVAFLNSSVRLIGKAIDQSFSEMKAREKEKDS